MSNEKDNLENLRLEYSEANANRRHYSNLRFAVLTVFFAVLGGLGAVAFGVVEIRPSSSSLNVVLWARIAGLIFTLIFFYIEIVCEAELRYFRDVAKDVRRLLGYHAFTDRKLGYLTFRNRHFRYVPRRPYVTWLMYVAMTAFWIYSIFRA